MGKQFIILKTGSSFAELVAQSNDFEHGVALGLGCVIDTGKMHVLHAQHSPQLPAAADVAGVVITGSHAMVSERAAWSERLVPWLQSLHANHTPLLGICFGHQLLAHALGGRVGYHPQGIEIGTQTIELLPAAAQDRLFSALPASFPAQLVHRQTVLQLPSSATLLARSQHEPHQAFRLGGSCWGVQFHPEFSPETMQAYIHTMADDLLDDSIDIQATLAAIQATPASASLLMQFAAVVAERL